jgi:di/tricarboxylate transporter
VSLRHHHIAPTIRCNHVDKPPAPYNITVWLVFTAFLLSKAVFCTRVGCLFVELVERLAHTTLRLGYSPAAALVPRALHPSVTARGGIDR